MPSNIDNLTTEYHDYVITDFTNAVLKSGLIITSGPRHRELPQWLRDDLTSVIHRSKCQFLLPYAGFLKDKGFFVDPAQIDDRLNLDLMLDLMTGYGKAIVGSLPGEVSGCTHIRPKHSKIGVRDNVTYVPDDAWRRHASAR